MRTRATVQICTAQIVNKRIPVSFTVVEKPATLTLSKRGLNHSLEQVKQALTQRGYSHTSVYVTTDGVAAGVLLDLLEGSMAVFPVRSLRMAVENGRRRDILQKTAPATRGSVGGTHGQI